MPGEHRGRHDPARSRAPRKGIAVMAPAPTAFPWWPLLATTGMQTLATMAAYSVPALAPVIARDLGVDGALSGAFVSVVYGVGIVSSLVAANFIHRYGAVRACQLVLVCALAMLVTASLGGLVAVAFGAVLLGVAYGSTAPSSTHLLVPRTPPRIINFVMSLRQIGVPLGGVLAGLTLPPLALVIGWEKAMLVIAVPVALLIALLEVPRRRWDAEDRHRTAAPGASVGATLRRLGRLLREDRPIRVLTIASFVYSGVQLCFVAFLTVHLTVHADFGVVAAGQALALYQVSGVVSRPIWGWFADRFVPAHAILTFQGFAMAAAVVAAGQFSAAWPMAWVLTVCAIAGATASGYTGLAYAEYARRAGERRTEATGLGAAAMFAGVLVIPSLASVVVLATGGYALAYGAVGLAAALAAITMALPRAR